MEYAGVGCRFGQADPPHLSRLGLSSGAEILQSEAKQNRSRRIPTSIPDPQCTNFATLAVLAMPRLQFTISMNWFGITPM